ncbi:hypothetical protein BN2497_7529 [Janthinobacterium sp. CG23_2]|nr:hypothetical protein BN2497_7529 [Janthinobacterium sp. CG23_2]CUU30162.1 hypothetical protein BN3177_7529 [Janthinobacterium sp. CG23_2]
MLRRNDVACQGHASPSVADCPQISLSRSAAAPVAPALPAPKRPPAWRRNCFGVTPLICLSSDESAYITAQTLNVDGGAVMS